MDWIISSILFQLTNHNKKLSEAEETAKKALDELAASKASWEEQLRVQKEQVKSIQNRCDELEGQNGMLHQQLETVRFLAFDFKESGCDCGVVEEAQKLGNYFVILLQ